eukprot:72676_1
MDRNWCNETLSRKFYSICKKCEYYEEDEIIQMLKDVASKCENGFDDININYESRRTYEYPLKFILKYLKPKVLLFLMEIFLDHIHETIDWMIIDNPKLRNNMLHFLLSDINGISIKDIKNAVSIINTIYFPKETWKRKLLNCYDLLYQSNDYGFTPSQYAQQRKLVKIGSILEKIQFRHIYQIMLIECHIHKDIALAIIEFSFKYYHFQDVVDASKINEIQIVSTEKSDVKATTVSEQNIMFDIAKKKKYKIGEKYFPYDTIYKHVHQMESVNSKEKYLTDVEFERVFGTTKDSFSRLPWWNKETLKKQYGLL